MKADDIIDAVEFFAVDGTVLRYELTQGEYDQMQSLIAHLPKGMDDQGEYVDGLMAHDFIELIHRVRAGRN